MKEKYDIKDSSYLSEDDLHTIAEFMRYSKYFHMANICDYQKCYEKFVSFYYPKWDSDSTRWIYLESSHIEAVCKQLHDVIKKIQVRVNIMKENS